MRQAMVRKRSHEAKVQNTQKKLNTKTTPEAPVTQGTKKMN